MKTLQDFIGKFKTILIIILLLLFIIFLPNSCKTDLKEKIITSLGGYTELKTTITIDTISIKYDSLFFKYDSIRHLVNNLEPKIEYKYITNSKSNKTSSSIIGKKFEIIDSVFVYNNAISDTILSGNIKTTINLSNCKIVEQSFDYKPKIPIIVKETITIEKIIENTISNKPRSKIGIGGEVSTKADVGILIAYQTKNNFQYQLGYKTNINKVETIDSKNFYNKGVVTLSILKFF